VRSDLYQALYDRLFQAFGPQHWWPADTILELCVGAILTQNVTWTNVEKALDRMEDRGLLSIAAIDQVCPGVLAEAIRPAGYYNVKARRLKTFASHVMDNYDGKVERFLDPARPVTELRRELLSIHGIGPETADSMLVYGAAKPAFIADAYGRRILSRIGLIREGAGYEEAREAVQAGWEPAGTARVELQARTSADTWGEFHALLVRLGKEHCTKNSPTCAGCPAEALCQQALAERNAHIGRNAHVGRNALATEDRADQ